MDANSHDDPLARRLRRDAEALPGPRAGWARELGLALDREPHPAAHPPAASPPAASPRSGAPAAGLLAAAALLLAATGLTLALLGPARPADPGMRGAAAPARRAAELLGGALEPVSLPALDAPLRRELAAVQRDARRAARLLVEGTRTPLRPFLRSAGGGS